MSAAQRLEQQVSHKFGWGVDIDVNEDGFWYADVTIGLDDTRRFVTDCDIPNTRETSKSGKAAASQAALDGLEQEIERMEMMPQKELFQVFLEDRGASIDVYDSADPTNWEYFWSHKPKIVGIDTEGNLQAPPVLAQVSTDEYTILEIPNSIPKSRKDRSSGLSIDLIRLLKDESIVKVFCDNFGQKDKKCLSVPLGSRPQPNADGSFPPSFTTGHILDIEFIACLHLGPSKVARGVSRIITLCMPELQVRIGKPKKAVANGNQKSRMSRVGKFALIEQGKAPPLKGLWELSWDEQQYAALDSWCTLQAYHRLVNHQQGDSAALTKEPAQLPADQNLLVSATQNQDDINGGKPKRKNGTRQRRKRRPGKNGQAKQTMANES